MAHGIHTATLLAIACTLLTEEDYGPRTAGPEDCWPRGLLAQRTAGTEDCWPRGLLAQRSAARGLLAQRTATPDHLPKFYASCSCWYAQFQLPWQWSTIEDMVSVTVLLQEVYALGIEIRSVYGLESKV